MHFVTCRKVSFALTLLATLSMLGSEAFARGGRGGGRSGGGRSQVSGGSRSMPTGGQRSGGMSNAGSRPGTNATRQLGQHGSGQFGNPTANAAGLSSQATKVKSNFSNSSQFQGMLESHSGQAASQLSQQNGQLQQSLETKSGQLQSGAQPFSPSWYAQHPNAWQATHPHADTAVVASAAAVTAWVGAAYYADTSSGGSSTTVVYAPTIEETAPTQPATIVVAPAAAAPAATQPQTDQPSNESESWLPIGTYAVSTTKQAPALLMVQLVVDHQGTLRGVYYDSVTDTTHNLIGKLDASTQVAKWQLESNSQVSFQTPLGSLTQPTGNLQVNLPVGPQQWLLARIDNGQ